MKTAALTTHAAHIHDALEANEPAALALVPAPDETTRKVPTPAVHARILAIVHRGKGEPPAGKYRQADIARLAEVGAEYLNAYVNWTPSRPGLSMKSVEQFEAALQEFLASLEFVRAHSEEGFSPFETPVSEAVLKFTQQRRAEGTAGVIHGDAGIGKTKALQLLQLAIPRAIVITVETWTQGAQQLAALIFRRLGLRRSRRGGSVITRVAESLADRPRTIVIDNAHQLRSSAYRFLFNLQDQHPDEAARRCAIIFVGNPEIEDALSNNDQFSSRLADTLNLNNIFTREGEKLASKGLAQINSVCRRLISQWLPGQEDVLAPLCRKVASVDGNGRFRAVQRRLRMTKNLLATDSFSGRPVEAFAAAHAKQWSREKISLD